MRNYGQQLYPFVHNHISSRCSDMFLCKLDFSLPTGHLAELSRCNMMPVIKAFHDEMQLMLGFILATVTLFSYIPHMSLSHYVLLQEMYKPVSSDQIQRGTKDLIQTNSQRH